MMLLSFHHNFLRAGFADFTLLDLDLHDDGATELLVEESFFYSPCTRALS